MLVIGQRSMEPNLAPLGGAGEDRGVDLTVTTKCIMASELGAGLVSVYGCGAGNRVP